MRPGDTDTALGAIRGPRAPLLALSLVASLVLALPGCGSDKAATASTTTSASASQPRTEPGRSRHETRQDIVNAVAACKQGVDTGTWLPSSSRQSLYRNCELGLRRGLTEIKAYGSEACNEVAFTSPAKSEAERKRVFEACYAGVRRATAKVH
jgi:hypothetical protein